MNQPEQEPREGEPLKLRERAYASFTERLLAREIKPGQFVTQRELVAMTGFPLGAIRELVPRLEAEGLIKTVPQRGMQVAHVDLNLIRNAFQFRLFLEKEATALYTRNATDAEIAEQRARHEAIIARAESEGKFARKLQTKGASHTQQMDPLLGELSAEIQGIEPHPLQTAYYSTVHEGKLIRAGAEPIHDVEYWKKGLRHSVYFTQGIRNAVDNGHTTFLELAPNPVALMQVGLTTAAAGLHDGQLIATLAKKQDEVESMVAAMAQLYVHGHDLDIRTLFDSGSGPAE